MVRDSWHGERVRRDANGNRDLDVARNGSASEFRQNLQDPYLDQLECANNRQSGSWPFLAESYLKGDVALHLHCNLRAVVGNLEPGDFCLSFERAEVRRNLARDKAGKPRGREVVMACRDAELDKMQPSVPVVVSQLVEKPKRIILRQSVRSVKRLLPLNDCLVFRRDTSHSLANSVRETAFSIEEFVPSEKDWELSELIDRLAILLSQPAGEMIQNGTELAKSLSGLDAPLWRRWAAAVDLYSEIARISLEISDNTAIFTINERGMFYLDASEMIMSRRQLCTEPVFPLCHGAYSHHKER